MLDPNLGAAAVYAVIACIYLRREHGKACRIILATAALILALSAAAKSDSVRGWHLHRLVASASSPHAGWTPAFLLPAHASLKNSTAPLASLAGIARLPSGIL
jgi:hypothetical protein